MGEPMTDLASYHEALGKIAALEAALEAKDEGAQVMHDRIFEWKKRAEAAEARAAKAEAHKCEERKIAYWVDSNGEQVWAWVGKGEQAAFEKKTEEQRAKGLYQPTWKARAEALEAIVRKARDALKNARNRQVNILELERQMNNALRESAPAGADNIQAPAWPLHEAKPAEASRRPKR